MVWKPSRACCKRSISTPLGEIANSKSQSTNKLKNQNTKSKTLKGVPRFEFWLLLLGVCLCFGFWCLKFTVRSLADVRVKDPDLPPVVLVLLDEQVVALGGLVLVVGGPVLEDEVQGYVEVGV